MIACFVISGVLFVLQVMSWIGGNAPSAAGGAYSFFFNIGSNFALILALVFLVLGFVLRSKKKKKQAEAAGEKQQPL